MSKIKYAFLICLVAMFSCKKPQGLQFTGFQNFRVQPLSFANSKISLGIGVFNPNAFDIKLNHLLAEITLDGSKLGNYQMDSLITLRANQPFLLPVELVVKNGALLRNMLSVMSGDSIPYSLSGKVKAGRKIGMAEIPFSYSGQLTQRDFNLQP